GGFAVIYLSKTKEAFALDFRETAPGDATWDMYVKAREKDPNAPPPSRTGGLAVAVPGLLAGAEQLLEEFGSMRLDQVIEPARALAERGFKADRHYVDACTRTIKDFEKNKELKEKCGALYRTLLRNGQAPKPGDLIQRPDLASALRLLSYAGTEAFYDGQIAEAIVKAVRATGGILTYEDLLGYRVRERKPIRFKYREFEIVSMPPPSSGGIVIAEALNILETRRLADIQMDDANLAAHLFIEACKHGFADRSRWLGDPAYIQIPQEHLTSKKYAKSLAEQIDDKKTLANRQYGSTRIKDDNGTSHFSVVDADDNVVAWTETINTIFGSYVVAEPYGIVLNDEMDDFSAEPGKPDAFGLRTSDRNAVAPGKRPLSSMSPTIVLDQGGLPILTLGASGGPRIISSVLNVLVNVLDYDMTLGEAIEANRIHHQWMPNEIRFSEPPDTTLAAELKKRGHKISGRRTTGIVQAIEWQEDNTLLGASDPRKGGRPAGH
ncbi:MAG: gamma-glutamyltransferase, partial [Phycisphaerae bacterium]|nr:gamma-glutamyltransferase [Phycisphaerae bacterium]